MLQHNSNDVSNNYHQSNNHLRTTSPPVALANQVSVSGDALKLVAVHRQSSIRLQTPGLDPMDVTAAIKGQCFLQFLKQRMF